MMTKFNWILSVILGAFTLMPLAQAAQKQNSPVFAFLQYKTQIQAVCSKPKKPSKTHYTIRHGKNGTSFSSRRKVGNTTITQTRTVKGKHKTTTSTRIGGVTYTTQY
ncbi:MAG: hypothetical protein IPG70_07725 [Moraxellaceae bacterium]|jgi:hypothetical protein|nr:hypothetical protein [Moraxellaceae bacterium]